MPCFFLLSLLLGAWDSKHHLCTPGFYVQPGSGAELQPHRPQPPQQLHEYLKSMSTLMGPNWPWLQWVLRTQWNPSCWPPRCPGHVIKSHQKFLSPLFLSNLSESTANIPYLTPFMLSPHSWKSHLKGLPWPFSQSSSPLVLTRFLQHTRQGPLHLLSHFCHRAFALAVPSSRKESLSSLCGYLLITIQVSALISQPPIYPTHHLISSQHLHLHKTLIWSTFTYLFI